VPITNTISNIYLLYAMYELLIIAPWVIFSA
jgi:hypothetical protein